MLKKGQTIYIQRVFARKSNVKSPEQVVDSLIETTVKSVGKKYFTVDAIPNVNFGIEEMRDFSNYGIGTNYIAYLTKDELRNKLEKEKLISELRLIFDYFNKTELSLSQLRRIKDIINENPNE